MLASFDKIEDVPTQAISMGIKNILDAKSIILFAYGESKAEAIAGTVSGPVTENLPASSLQNHPDVTIIRWCWGAQPAWKIKITRTTCSLEWVVFF